MVVKNISLWKISIASIISGPQETYLSNKKSKNCYLSRSKEIHEWSPVLDGLIILNFTVVSLEVTKVVAHDQVHLYSGEI